MNSRTETNNSFVSRSLDFQGILGPRWSLSLVAGRYAPNGFSRIGIHVGVWRERVLLMRKVESASLRCWPRRGRPRRIWVGRVQTCRSFLPSLVWVQGCRIWVLNIELCDDDLKSFLQFLDAQLGFVLCVLACKSAYNFPERDPFSISDWYSKCLCKNMGTDECFNNAEVVAMLGGASFVAVWPL